MDERAFTGLVAAEIRHPLYTSINFPAVTAGAISADGRLSDGRLNNLDRERYYIAPDAAENTWQYSGVRDKIRLSATSQILANPI